MEKFETQELNPIGRKKLVTKKRRMLIRKWKSLRKSEVVFHGTKHFHFVHSENISLASTICQILG